MSKADLGPLNHFAIWNFLDNFATVWKHEHRVRRGAKHIASLEKRKKEWGPENPSHPAYQMMSGKYDKRFYSDFKAVLGQFVASARDAGSEVLIVMIPDSVQLNDEHLQEVNRFVRQAAAGIEVPFLDTTPVLEREPDAASLYLFPHDAHNSPRGLMLIAEAIAETIVNHGFMRRQATDTPTRLIHGQGSFGRTRLTLWVGRDRRACGSGSLGEWRQSGVEEMSDNPCESLSLGSEA